MMKEGGQLAKMATDGDDGCRSQTTMRMKTMVRQQKGRLQQQQRGGGVEEEGDHQQETMLVKRSEKMRQSLLIFPCVEKSIIKAKKARNDNILGENIS